MTENLDIEWWLAKWEELLPITPESNKMYETVTIKGKVTTHNYSSTKTTEDDFKKVVEKHTEADAVARYTAGVALLAHAVAIETAPRSDAMELCRWLGEMGLECLAKKSEPTVDLTIYLAELLTHASPHNFIFPISKSVTTLLKAFDEVGQPAEVAKPLRELHSKFAGNTDTHGRRIAQKLSPLLDQEEDVPTCVDNKDAWGQLINRAIAEYPQEKQSAWSALLAHAQKASRAKPTKAWLKKAEPLVEQLTEAELAEGIREWIAQLGSEPIGPSNSDVLRGLAHSAVLISDDLHAPVAAALADAVEAGCRRGTGGKLLCSKLSVAALETLAAMESHDAAGQLFRLKRNLTAEWIAEKIAPLCTAAATKMGASEHEFEEDVVPSLDFNQEGVLCLKAGEHVAEISFPTTSKGQLHWIDIEGKRRKTAPAAVKAEHNDVLTHTKRLLRDADRIVTAQRNRLDRCFVERAVWNKKEWLKTHLEHPLVSVVAKRLIWSFIGTKKSTHGIWNEDHFQDADGKKLNLAKLPSEVSLWHPLDEEPTEVEHWRDHIAALGICQPFKQAHREIYRLTATEQETTTYSGRFASHVVRHSQFRALAQSRGWKTPAIGNWDHGSVYVSRPYPHLGLEAQLWIEPADGATEESGIYKRIIFDQIRFYATSDEALEILGATGSREAPLPLPLVPPLLFSEVMRDVDLFVGVSSIGNAHDWQIDPDQQARHHPYCERYAYGELSVTAQSRRAALQKLLPKLKIADRCSLGDRFLTVRGELRTYKIHIGSANILMEPNDQYLCVVPARSSADKVFLPFEGDQRLAVILSKAFMLANDIKIKDPTILSQIQM